MNIRLINLKKTSDMTSGFGVKYGGCREKKKNILLRLQSNPDQILLSCGSQTSRYITQINILIIQFNSIQIYLCAET
jgi:hypothetical protein